MPGITSACTSQDHREDPSDGTTPRLVKLNGSCYGQGPWMQVPEPFPRPVPMRPWKRSAGSNKTHGARTTVSHALDTSYLVVNERICRLAVRRPDIWFEQLHLHADRA